MKYNDLHVLVENLCIFTFLPISVSFEALTRGSPGYQKTIVLGLSSSSSSSPDRVDSRGPLRQPGVAATTSLRPFSTNAEGCTIADLLDPRATNGEKHSTISYVH